MTTTDGDNGGGGGELSLFQVLMELTQTLTQETHERTRQFTSLQQQIKDLVEQPSDADDDEEAEPATWAANATGEDMAALIEWVDGLQAAYELRRDVQIPGCWPTHPGVVEELAGLFGSWRAAAVDRDRAKMPAWHEDLRKGLQRIHTLGAITNCRGGHRDPPPSPVTVFAV